MARKLEASGHIRRTPAASDKRASVVELTESGRILTDRVKEMWCALAEETVTALREDNIADLPHLLHILTENVDRRRARRLEQGGQMVRVRTA
ncbi:hypothetical protein JK358_35515 [Nocardia sp. 2]|uniref:HTH marR-type domain-containing protein n=2 Tax=Nocardia acididurans TaxID=2802282 RepID=A0ABS1MI58_9NOCA|nr:hypothetical protein [Nocardia acididurans]